MPLDEALTPLLAGLTVESAGPFAGSNRTCAPGARKDSYQRANGQPAHLRNLILSEQLLWLTNGAQQNMIRPGYIRIFVRRRLKADGGRILELVAALTAKY